MIVISAVTEEWAKVDVLDAGADDYETKPFGIAELLARVRARLGRAGSHRTPLIELGELVVDLENRSEELPRRLHAVLEPAVGADLHVAREGA